MLKIHQRRYLGNKNSLLNFIHDIIKTEIGSFESFCDIFAGTGVVGHYFNNKDIKIISNDLLYHNSLSLNAFLGTDYFDKKKILQIINNFNKINNINEDNYFSAHFGGKYFDKNIARKIGSIRESIYQMFKNKEINEKENSILITSLIYSIDKIANTVGHYDAFIKKEIPNKSFKMELLEINSENNLDNEVYNQDANKLIKHIKCDILYLDPPYNSRQYSDAYHLLENLSLWKKPEVFGIAKKFNRKNIKSQFNLKTAKNVFEELIVNANTKYILFSYNNMSNKGNTRSNAKISDEDILRILKNKGKVKVFEKNYKEFNAGKNKIGNNKERIFFVEVK